MPLRDPALDEILAGLSQSPKDLPPKYFYDEAGCALFERICALPEYYLTRAELQLMERHIGAIAAFVGSGVRLIEFGSGSGRKTRSLIEATRPALYMPIDIAEPALRGFGEALAREYPWLAIAALRTDFTLPLTLPDLPELRDGRRVVYFPGSTVGNFDRPAAAAFLAGVRRMVGEGGALLIGVDLKKDPRCLHEAYNDAAGVTAAFNLNMLVHLNRRYGADFDLGAFEHVAFYDGEAGRIEMHLQARRDCVVTMAGRRFEFSAGERMRTEISCKYDADEFAGMARGAGFGPARAWFDDARQFALFGCDAV
jgi:dimethylhistidine N-methyltransferase